MMDISPLEPAMPVYRKLLYRGATKLAARLPGTVIASILGCRPHVQLGGNFGNANAHGDGAVEPKFGRDETELKLPRPAHGRRTGPRVERLWSPAFSNRNALSGRGAFAWSRAATPGRDHLRGVATVPVVAVPERERFLLISEKRQQDFAFFSDEAQKRSTCILFAFFEIGVSDNNGFDRGIFNFRVGLCNCHAVNIERHVFNRRITFSQSNQSRGPTRIQLRRRILRGGAVDRGDHKKYYDSEPTFSQIHLLFSKTCLISKQKKPPGKPDGHTHKLLTMAIPTGEDITL
jgi:hypothetical protein